MLNSAKSMQKLPMLEFVLHSKDRFFYDQYQYGICVSIEEAGCLRAKSIKELHAVVNSRNKMRNLWADRRKDLITDQMTQNLITVWEELDAVRSNIKIVISYNILYIYSNDIQILQQLSQIKLLKFNHAVQAVIDRPRDVVFKTNPQFQYRSYFKELMMSQTDRERLAGFLSDRREFYGITNRLMSTLNNTQKYCWLQRHHFVEHNDAKDITMLSLVMPGLIRKTVPVQAK